MSKRTVYVGVIFVILLVVGVMVALLLQQDSSDEIDQNATVLIEVERQGGMCPNGPCNDSIGTVYSDGTYTRHSRISDVDMVEIRRLIKDFDRSRYESGSDCGQSTFDAGDIHLVIPQKYGEKSFEKCRVKTDLSNSKENQIELLIDMLNKYKAK